MQELCYIHVACHVNTSGNDLALYQTNKTHLHLFVSNSFCSSLRTDIKKGDNMGISFRLSSFDKENVRHVR